jgi:hypothetical protein
VSWSSALNPNVPSFKATTSQAAHLHSIQACLRGIEQRFLGDGDFGIHRDSYENPATIIIHCEQKEAHETST